MKIKKTYSLFPGGELEITPYADYYNNINNSYIIIYFFQLLISISILLLGAYYALFYSRKIKNFDFLLLFILCLLISIYTFVLSPFSYYISERTNLDLMLIYIKIRLCSLYLQPYIELLFILKIFHFDSKIINKIKFFSALITIILIVLILLIYDSNLLVNTTIIFHPFAIIHFVIFVILASISSFNKNYSSIFVLIGLLLFSIFSIVDIADNWKIVNITNRYPVYTIGIFFIFLLGAYISRQFVKVNLNLIDLIKTLEHKVKDRTKRIEEMSKQKTDFFGNISHELRTPLTLILGPVESIVAGKYGEKIDSNDEKLRMILYNGVKLLKLINNLLDFTKIDSSIITAKKQKNNISLLLKYYVSSVKSTAENMGLNIIFNDNNTEGNLISYTDTDMLEKSVFNLISNSLKFTPAGGQIIVQLDKNDNEYVISVKDTGIGIPNNKLDTIFERFSQVDSSMSKRYEGTGIGLALTKEFVNALGGKISVKSKLNYGSVFCVVLPLIEKSDENNDSETETIEGIKSYSLPEAHYNNNLTNNKIDQVSKNTSDAKILIVEDNSDMQKYLSSILKNDYKIYFAKNGIEGIEKAIKEMPDIILSDVMMPEMDGYTMTELIKSMKELQNIPIILLTAKADIFMKMEGFEKGADDYIVKLFDSKELCARIKVHFQIKKLRDDLIRKNLNLEKVINEKNFIQKNHDESENRFRDMAENLPVAIIEINMEKRISYYNKYANELLNISINDYLFNYLNVSDNQDLSTIVDSLYQKESFEIIQFKLKTKAGKTIKALIKSNLIYKNDRIIGLRIIILEVESNINFVLSPDKKFYKKYEISDREQDVILLLLKGLSSKNIADNLLISSKTVDNHIRNIYEKTYVNNRHDLVKIIQQKY